MAQAADGAVLAAGLQAENTEGLGDNHLLLLVVGGRDTLEDLEALKGGGTTGGLVGDHATDGLVEDSGGSAEVEGTCDAKVNRLHSRAMRIKGIGDSPPRVGLYRVILRRWAAYLTAGTVSA